MDLYIITSMNTFPLRAIVSQGRLPLIHGAAGAAALASVLALTPGCVVAVRPAPVATVYAQPVAYAQTGEVVVSEEPPPPIAEVVAVAPGPGFFWIGGYYHWSGARWVWYRGHYERPPRPGAAWIRARYEVRGGRRVYIRGFWR
jgi:hypothetical protein